jgi:methylmalonyl-CoA epimerase
MADLDHVGWAASSVSELLDTLDRLLNIRPYKAETVSGQQVRTHFLDAGPTKLEVLESLDSDSAVGRFLDRHGEGVHHLAFEVQDLPSTLERLRAAGFTVLQDAPEPGADDKRIAFVHPRDTHGVLVEFCETRPPDWSPRRIDHEGRTLGFYERGDPERPTLLLVHGSAGSTRLDSGPLMRRLEPAVHLVGLDLSGHGASSLPADGRLTMDRLVGDVGAALNAVDASSAHLFGFSLGTGVALRFALRHPSRVDRLALLAPKTLWTREEASGLQSTLHPAALREQSPERADRLAAEHDDLEALLSALRALVESLPADSEPLHAALPDVDAPTLVAGYDADPLVAPEDVQATYEALPNARLTILPGDRHSLARGPLEVLSVLIRRHLGAG